MKVQKILLAVATVMLLTTSSAWAERGGESKPHTAWHEHGHWFGHWFRHGHGHWFRHGNENGHGHGHGLVKAPEIDAASGTSAIALLTGVLLLTGERYRSRRS
ncbi:MAG TPA: VPEID-CTERM sorting domain-containing protein [Methylobacter sp.]